MVNFDWPESKRCPVHKASKGVHRIPKQPGDIPGMTLFVCDTCKIGWWDARGAGPMTKLPGTLKAARDLYIPLEGRNGRS